MTGPLPGMLAAAAQRPVATSIPLEPIARAYFTDLFGRSAVLAELSKEAPSVQAALTESLLLAVGMVTQATAAAMTRPDPRDADVLDDHPVDRHAGPQDA